MTEPEHQPLRQLDVRRLEPKDAEWWRQLWTDPKPTTLEWTQMRDSARALNAAIPLDSSRKATLGLGRLARSQNEASASLVHV